MVIKGRNSISQGHQIQLQALDPKLNLIPADPESVTTNTYPTIRVVLEKANLLPFGLGFKNTNF